MASIQFIHQQVISAIISNDTSTCLAISSWVFKYCFGQNPWGHGGGSDIGTCAQLSLLNTCDKHFQQFTYIYKLYTWIWKVFLLHLQASPFASPCYSNRYGISTGRSAGSSAKNTRGPHYVNRSFANGCPKFNCAPSVSHVRQTEPIRNARRAHSAPSTFPWHARVLDVCRWKLEVE